MAQVAPLLVLYAPQAHAHEAQMLARISASLLREAQALQVEAVCWVT